MQNNPGDESAQLSSDGVDLSERESHHERRVARFGVHRSRSLALCDTLEARLREVSIWGAEALYAADTVKRVGRCGSWLLFRDYWERGVVKLERGCSCDRHLCCGLCAIRRASRYVGATEERLRGLASVWTPETDTAQLHVVTVKNGADLSERFTHLEGCLRRLLQRRRDAAKTRAGTRRKSAPSALLEALGGMYSIEVHRGAGSGEWHPHANLLTLSQGGAEVDGSALAEEWREITRDSHVTHTQTLRPDAEGSIRGSLIEVAKYALKLNGLSLPDQWMAAVHLRRRRLTGTWGALYGVDRVPEVREDLGLWREMVYSWDVRQSSYTRTPEKEQPMPLRA